jgi:hypothetical protein
MKDPINCICVAIIVIVLLAVAIVNNGCQAIDGFKADVLEKVKEEVDEEVAEPEEEVVIEEPAQPSDIELVKKLKFGHPAHTWMAQAGSQLERAIISMTCWKDGHYVFCDKPSRAPEGRCYVWFAFDKDFNYIGYTDNSGNRGGPLVVDHHTPMSGVVKYLVCYMTDAGHSKVYERSELKEI